VSPEPDQANAHRRVRAATGTDDAERWREAATLRQQWPKWVVIWLAPTQQFRAYRRLPGARRVTALTAPTVRDLSILISQAEQATRTATELPDEQTEHRARNHPGQ
jgi:hypothetical protein